MLNHLDLFSGIGGFSLGLEQAGFKTIAFCEVDKYCQKVLRSHWNVPIFNDIRELDSNNLRTLGKVDIISAGFPCQDVSIAGKRKGLRGERSGLFSYLSKLIGDIRPVWFIIENVPGLLSSNKGRDFRYIINQMDEFGYCVSWRLLDSQYFGLPQRRERVFIIGSLGDTSSAEVLFDKTSGAGYTTENKEKDDQTSRVSRDGTYSFDSRNSAVNGRITQTLQSKSSGGWSLNYMPIVGKYWDGGDIADTGDVSMLMKGQMMPEKRRFPVVWGPTLRRLTPLEWERLQGFPDNFTSMCSDTQRYKQLGNAVSVPVIKWLGERISNV